MQEIKEDLKQFGQDVKSIFGKVQAAGKKALRKLSKDETENAAAVSEVKPEKGIKAFGSKVKMGFSKLFSSKNDKHKPPTKFEE